MVKDHSLIQLPDTNQVSEEQNAQERKKGGKQRVEWRQEKEGKEEKRQDTEEIVELIFFWQREFMVLVRCTILTSPGVTKSGKESSIKKVQGIDR